MLTKPLFLSRRKLGIIIFLLILCSLAKVNYLKVATKSDFLIFSLFGYEKGTFAFAPFLLMLFLNGLPLSLISLSMFKGSFEKSRKGFNEMQQVHFEIIVIYALVQMLITWIIAHYFLTDSAVYFYIIANDSLSFLQLNPIIVWLDVWLVRIMELLTLQMIVVVLNSFFRNMGVVFLICMTLHLFLIFDVSNFYPIGISSIKRLLLLDENFIFAIYKALFSLSSFYFLGYFYMISKVYNSKRL